MVPRGVEPDEGQVQHASRNLCRACYSHHRRRDTLDRFPRVQLDPDATHALARRHDALLRQHPHATATWRAQQLGMPRQTMRTALARARARETSTTGAR